MKQPRKNFIQKLYNINVFAVLATLFVSVGILCIAFPTSAQSPEARDSIKKYHEMLAPVVQVRPITGVGSGVIIYSAKRDKKWYTYILTNYHIISSSISKENEKKAGVVKEFEQTQNIRVRWIEDVTMPEEGGSNTNNADVITYDENADLALLLLRNHDSGPQYIASLQSNDTTLSIFDTVWTVGAGLGFPPFPTIGIVGNLNVRNGLKSYIQASPQIIYGNSGGGLFSKSSQNNRYEMVGMFVLVPTTPEDGAITHMGLFIPTKIIREFLKNKGFDFILKEQERLATETRVISD